MKASHLLIAAGVGLGVFLLARKLTAPKQEPAQTSSLSDKVGAVYTVLTGRQWV